MTTPWIEKQNHLLVVDVLVPIWIGVYNTQHKHFWIWTPQQLRLYFEFGHSLALSEFYSLHCKICFNELIVRLNLSHYQLAIVKIECKNNDKKVVLLSEDYFVLRRLLFILNIEIFITCYTSLTAYRCTTNLQFLEI